jgi:DNA polymerase I
MPKKAAALKTRPAEAKRSEAKPTETAPAKPTAKTPATAEAKASGAKGKQLCLVDGSGYIFRAYHALPPLTRPDGTPVGAVLGFTNMLLKLMASHNCDSLAVIFDAGRKTFRNDIYANYKANRDEPPPELIPQFGLIREATKAFNVPSIESPGFEADDLLATYAKAGVESGWNVTIVSSDKDLMQLVRPGVDMLDPIKYRPIGAPEVRERFGVGPEKVVEVQALIGDSVDNVPGVPGIGPTAAAACINTYGNLKKVLDAAENPDKFAEPFARAAQDADKELFAIAGRECKYGPTSRELGAILFEQLDVPGGKKDAKGGWDISNDTLQTLASKHKVVTLVLECREKARAASAARGWAEKIATNRDLAETSLKLVLLKDDVTLPTRLDELKVKTPDPKTLVAFLAEQGFRSVITRLKTEGLVDADFDVEAVPKMTNTAKVAEAAETAGGAAAAQDQPPAAMAPRACQYEIVRDMKTLQAWIARATAAGAFAIDTETTSVYPLHPDTELVGISLAVAAADACYIPIGHKDRGSDPAKSGGELDLGGEAKLLPGQLPCADVLAALAPVLADPTVLKIGHNLKFDAEILARIARKLLKRDLPIAPIDDTMLISYVLGGGKHAHNMDDLSDIYLGHKTLTFDEVTGTGKSRISFAQVALDRAGEYAAEDADVTFRLHEVLKPMLAAQHLVSVYETIERPLVPVLQTMEEIGIAVDLAELRRLSNDFALRCQDLEKKIHKEAGRPFTIGSPQQLGQILFDELHLQLPEGKQPQKTKTGAYATGADVLEDLAAVGHKLPELVLDWRQISKLKSTYADALVEQVNRDTGRVHTCFAMAVASTGRLSSSDPNLQNIPVRTEEGRKIRKAFVAGPGTTLLSFDYSQIELRLLAHVADIAALKDAFRDDIDIHALTASQVFNVPVKGMDPMIRRKAKAINFGIIYGISAFGLARQLGIPQGEARAYIDAYFTRYPGIRDYMERTKEFARKHGYVTTIFGRRVHLPEIASKNGAMRSFQERAAINAPIQGGAADIIKRAMVRVPPALAAGKLSAKLLLQVHDELLFEVTPAEVDRTIEIVKRVMETADRPVVAMSVPLVVEVGKGQSWADAH